MPRGFLRKVNISQMSCAHIFQLIQAILSDFNALSLALPVVFLAHCWDTEYAGFRSAILPYYYQKFINNVIPLNWPQSFRGGPASRILESSDLVVPLNSWIVIWFHCQSITTLENILEEVLSTFYSSYTQFYICMARKHSWHTWIVRYHPRVIHYLCAHSKTFSSCSIHLPVPYTRTISLLYYVVVILCAKGSFKNYFGKHSWLVLSFMQSGDVLSKGPTGVSSSGFKIKSPSSWPWADGISTYTNPSKFSGRFRCCLECPPRKEMQRTC